MMSSRQDRVLHLRVETEEMYGVFSPDRSRLLTGGDGANPKVHIWDVETGDCLRVLNGHKEPVAALAWARINDRWLRALSIEMFASGTWLQVSALVS